MARNDFRRFRDPSVDRAQLRANVDSPADCWRSLANVTVASALVVAAVVSALALLEAVFSTSTVRLARQAPSPSEPQSWHVRAPAHEPFSPTATQAEPVLFATD